MSQIPLVTICCEVPLDARNGGGMRTLLQFLGTQNIDRILSVHTGVTHNMGDTNLQTPVDYLQVRPYGLGQSVRSNLSNAYEVSQKMNRSTPVIALVNSWRDLSLAATLRLMSDRLCLWVMDDFVSTPGASFKMKTIKSFEKAMMKALWKTSHQRLCVSQVMADEYSQRYGRPNDHVFSKSWPESMFCAPLKKTEFPKVRIGWVGRFLDFYSEPLFRLADLVRKNPNVSFEIDLWGQDQPPEQALVDGVIRYRGSFLDDEVLNLLNEYDYGLVAYSSDERTKKFMNLSFPGKATDYMCAGIPVLTLAPRSLKVVEGLAQRDVGPVIDFNSDVNLLVELNALTQVPAERWAHWAAEANRWASAEFEMGRNSERFENLLMDSR